MFSISKPIFCFDSRLPFEKLHKTEEGKVGTHTYQSEKISVKCWTVSVEESKKLEVAEAFPGGHI